MSTFSLPTLNLAPLTPLGFQPSQPSNDNTAHSTDVPSTWDSVTSAIEGAIGGVISSGSPYGAIGGAAAGAAGAQAGDAWSIGRIVAIILGFLLIAGGIIALTVSKETIVQVAKTAAIAA